MSRSAVFKLVAALAAVVLVAGGIILFGLDRKGGPSLDISPGRGPDGTSATITITGAHPNAPVTITYDGRTPDTGTTDGDGRLSITHVFNGRVGDAIAVEALIGVASDQTASGSFEITGPGGGPAPTVSVSPDRGPSGTSATVTVTGEADQPVTLYIGGNAVTNGQTDAGGSWTYQHSFTGRSGEQITVEAQIGSGVSAPKGSATFTITEAADQTTEVSVSVGPSSGPSGTSAIVTVTGAANQPVTLRINGSGVTSGSTDASGRFTYETSFSGRAGDRIPVEAQVGSTADSPKGSAEFEISSAAVQPSVSVDPSSGPTGTSATITVTGEPNQPVTLTIGGTSTNGQTDASGTWAYQTTFSGAVGDRIAIEAQVGPSADSPKATTEFTITGTAISGGPFIFRVGFDPFSDEGGHGPIIAMPRMLDLRVTIGSITIEGPEPFVGVTGDLADDGTFTAIGSGTVAGFPDVTVVFAGAITAETLMGQYTMGAGAELPGGEPIVYEVTGEMISDESGAPDFQGFYDAFNAAQAAEDASALAALLHQATIDRYGAEACDAYLEGIVNPDVSIEFVEQTGFGEWDYDRDAVSTIVPDAYTLTVLVRVGEADPVEQEAHLAIRADGTLGWFTDCGDPLG